MTSKTHERRTPQFESWQDLVVRLLQRSPGLISRRPPDPAGATRPAPRAVQNHPTHSATARSGPDPTTADLRRLKREIEDEELGRL